jgi:ribonuclease E
MKGAVMASEETTDQPAVVEAVAETAGKPAPKRRRATKKAAAPAEAYAAEPAGAEPATSERATSEQATSEPAAEPVVEAAPAAPAKKASKRAPRKKAAPAVPVIEDEAAGVSDAAVTDEPEAPEPVAPAAVEEPAAEASPETETETEPEDETETEGGASGTAAAVPSFGLLFQAPDTTVVHRSRRATAPVQAPPPVAETDEASQPHEPTIADEDSDSTGPSAEGAEGEASETGGRRRRRGGRGRKPRAGDEGDAPGDQTGGAGPAATEATTSGADADDEGDDSDDTDGDDSAGEDSGRETSRRRRRRRRSGTGSGDSEDPPGTVTRVRQPRATRDEPTAVKGSTRLEAKKQRRREGREAGRRRTIITEAEFLARRESVDRVMVVRGTDERTQIGVLEDGVLVEHYVSRETSTTMVGNVYLGRVQNVLPSMEAAFVDIGKGRNAVLYAGEVNWDAAGLEVNQAKRIENALTSGDTVLVQVTKDPIGHKGARLTSQISLPGRFLVYVPEGSMTGISRKLPDTERARLKAILKEIVPDSAGVIVRTAAEGASEEELRADVERLTKAWDKISAKVAKASSKKAGSGGAPLLVHGEPDLTVRVIRDIFTEDFSSLVVSGEKAWADVSEYVEDIAPDLAARVSRWTHEEDLFTHHRVQEQIAKAMDRKVWLPSGGSLVIDRTEAMTVVDVNTGKFVGSGGNLEETVTKNNIEAAEEIVRQLRLRDIGGIIVIDFIDMVLESNRDLVVRRLLECLGRDRTKHQVAEVTSLGLVQMTRKRVGSGLIEVFSETCEHCSGRGIIVHAEPIDKPSGNGGGPQAAPGAGSGTRSRGRRGASADQGQSAPEPERKPSGPTAAQIAAAAHAAAVMSSASVDATEGPAADGPVDQEAPVEVVVEIDGDEPVLAAEPVPAEEPAMADGPVPAVEPVMAAEPEQPEFHASTPAVDAASDSTSDATAGATTDTEGERTPAPRGRRRRGRVVAPAGPPRAASEE